MKIIQIKIVLLLMCFSNHLTGQFDINLENANNLRKEYCSSNPIKIKEVRIQRDSFENEYEAWIIETDFENNKVSKYSMTTNDLIYIEKYNWKHNEKGFKLVRIDSTFYTDTTKVYRFGGNLSEKINHCDTIVLLFNEYGNLVYKEGSRKWGRISNKYDKQKNLMSLKTFDHENRIILSKSWKHIYDAEGNLQESKVYQEGELTDYVKIFHKGELEQIDRISYVKNEPITFEKMCSYYNSNRKIRKRIEEVSKIGLEKTAKNEFHYNEQEDLIYQTGSTLILDDLHFASFRYEYKYDVKNNWVERTTYLKQNDEKEFSWFNKDLNSSNKCNSGAVA